MIEIKKDIPLPSRARGFGELRQTFIQMQAGDCIELDAFTHRQENIRAVAKRAGAKISIRLHQAAPDGTIDGEGAILRVWKTGTL
jgi:hypothetical protein